VTYLVMKVQLLSKTISGSRGVGKRIRSVELSHGFEDHTKCFMGDKFLVQHLQDSVMRNCEIATRM
jgi:hypothetical protein